jgi:hypothetical protein
VFVGLGCGAGPCLVAAWISGLYSHIRGIEIMHWKFMECSMLLSKLLLSRKMQQQQQQHNNRSSTMCIRIKRRIVEYFRWQPKPHMLAPFFLVTHPTLQVAR